MSAASAAVSLIVGLGNPGAEYTATRHNAGFWLADALARQAGVAFREQAKFHGAVCQAGLDGTSVWLLKPMTFMNRSGQAVAALARFYKIPVERILVVHDELDLPPGRVRFKQGGGHGGHNGLRDLHAHLGSKEFYRLRLGIGHPGHRDQVTPYVLSRPPAADQTQIDTAIERALEVMPWILRGEFQRVMNVLHADA